MSPLTRRKRGIIALTLGGGLIAIVILSMIAPSIGNPILGSIFFIGIGFGLIMALVRG